MATFLGNLAMITKQYYATRYPHEVGMFYGYLDPFFVKGVACVTR
jgi:hypothetical protein